MSYFLGILPVNGVNFWQLGAPAQHWGATWFNALQWVCSSYSISQNRSLTLWFLRCQQTSYLNLEMCLNSTVTVSFRTHGTSNSCAVNWSKYSSALQDIYSAGCSHFIWQLIPGLPCMLIQHFTLHIFRWTLQLFSHTFNSDTRHFSYVSLLLPWLQPMESLTLCIFTTEDRTHLASIDYHRL